MSPSPQHLQGTLINNVIKKNIKPWIVDVISMQPRDVGLFFLFFLINKTRENVRSVLNTQTQTTIYWSRKKFIQRVFQNPLLIPTALKEQQN